ncbi:lysis protein [Pantoea sp. CCBC3-3-1]|uniref:lysis protein n=1 Tax=Pantoea sp. CCBC3-3-1 TaxID=2490851 RepID=UPI0011BF9884|nr:lysis protein [Pantoea sp. CCBC3-3-1]
MIGGILVTAAVAYMISDRFLMKRSDITKLRVGDHKVENGHLRIPFFFNVKFNRLKGATVEYTLRDKRFPTTVIAGGRRTLEHSRTGENCEYLDIPATKVTPDGIWIVRVKVVHGDSFLNPLYRIFPLQLVVEKEFDVQMKRDTQNA